MVHVSLLTWALYKLLGAKFNRVVKIFRLGLAGPVWLDAAMSQASLHSIVGYCNRLLRTSQIHDWPESVNGLQVENRGHVTRIGAAVDASLATVRMAVAAEADFLLVHHGLFWDAQHPWTGRRYQMLHLLVERNVAVYSSHLPLDAHPQWGNNARICAALGFKRLEPFYCEKEQFIGFKTATRISRTELAARLQALVGAAPIVAPGGPAMCRKIGVVSGGAGDHLRRVASEGVDTYITGEGPHHSYALAEELGLNVFYAGHYATETLGVKALAAHLAQKFQVPWQFLDHPTGL
jgi:dinuclear metal center YbgI/SA1388 family protein